MDEKQSVETVLSMAGRRNQTVRIKVEDSKGNLDVFEVEPYGRKQKDGGQMFFCLDIKNQEYRNIELSRIREAEMTRRLFKPRFPVDF
ncbi:WYL domain-containing protein [Geopsychrobacter electrodiphilus]|uniref:WYL domain-containing protein n=1 Tax=Geopsychrobacter electrodiphilus TaxID=225196 RepID=UPI0003785F5F|nr:WYL domain-containing protein [Geopsychrobacter electrodiphilus]